MRILRGLLAPVAVIVWLGACSDGTNPVPTPVPTSLDIAGVWDWTATTVDPYFGVICSDTGSFRFDQTDSTVTGSARQSGVCKTLATGETSHYVIANQVANGKAGADSLGFSIYYCTFTAAATGRPQQLSGQISCGGGVSGAWQAHRAGPVAAVALQLNPPPVLLPNDTVWVYAWLRDSAGSRVFFRTVTWASDRPTVAAVAGTADSVAVITSAVGTATISATVEGQSASTMLTVLGRGAVTVTTSTSGVDIDADGYLTNVDGTIRPIAVNGAVTFDSVVPATVFVALAGVADNCTVGGTNTTFVTVTPGETTAVAFTVDCTAAGSIHVATVSAGADVPSAYAVTVDNSSSDSIGATGAVVFQPLGARSHIVYLDTPTHCAVTPSNPVTVDVTGGGTTDVAFSISCAAIGRIAFASGSGFAVVQADGSASFPFPVTGFQPAWAPDGKRLAFSPFGSDCAGAPVGTVICVMNADGTGVSGLPVPAASSQVGLSWSPDGTRIAYVASGNLHAVKVDGSGDTTVTSGVVVEGFPRWSPDGGRIAFGCAVETGNSDICVVNADGSGLVRLTTDPAADGRPAWKPDGSAIVFSTTRSGRDFNGNPAIAVMDPDGTLVTAIGHGDAPAWSPDGGRVAFLYTTTVPDPHGAPYSYLSLMVMRADGSGLRSLSYASSTLDTPAWQP